MPSPFYPESVVLFQLHGGMVSHWILTSETISVLAACFLVMGVGM